MLRFYPTHTIATSTGLLLVRLVMGAAFMFHGWPKIQNPLHWLDRMSSPPPAVLQALSAVAEFVGGAALILGVLTPLAAFGLVCTMAGALATVHIPARHPFVDAGGGHSFELAAIYLAVSLLLLLTGPGRWSLDALGSGALRGT